ncbi:uncharacterized protein LOC100678423 [Nasonia vitripennis]|uniref:Uncharacterized protein n=1 Tax=Nasonia vitripennis TaxID=7425 RepID=A0A7M7GCX0_NASVI|nr:uncharacterized protein LOC100678423 [Nasonia vitripennis]
MMMKLKFLAILFFAIICNSLALRRSGNILYFEDDLPKTKQSTSMLSDIAHELFRRSSSSSQVLNLNLSNLLLLLVLKAVVYGAGYIGNHAFKGRGDVVENNILSEGETALALGYLMGDNCLYQAACEVPHTAKEYLGAAEIVFQTINLLPRSIPIGDSYEQTMTEFRKAIDHGLKDQCPSDYSCKKENIHRFLRPQ